LPAYEVETNAVILERNLKRCVMKSKVIKVAGCQWLTPIKLPAQEAEVGRIVVQSQPRQIVSKTLSQKHPS
jgi:hypothetical protein